MKASQWMVAICLGLLIGVLVFTAVRHRRQPVQLKELRPTPEDSVENQPDSKSTALQSASDLVRIPGGLFHSGSRRAEVNIPEFWIDRTEVTNSQYEAYLNECPLGSKCGPRNLSSYWEDQPYLENRRDHPVVYISWDDSSSFCRWEEGRLPSADEWEKAARGTDERTFPIGNEIDPASVNILGADRHSEKLHAPRQVATWGVHDKRYTRDRSPYGVLAMAGNVSEWTSTADERVPSLRLAFGGSYDSWSLTEDAKVDHQNAISPTAPSWSLGFRCAYSFEPTVRGTALRVASEPDTPPMLTKTETGEYAGFDWEIADAIATRIGVDQVKIIPGKYSELPGRLISGKADVIISGYTADPSIEGIDWSDSYFDYGLCLVVRKGSPIRSINDLQGKVIGIFNDPAAEADVKSLVPAYRRLEKYEDGYFDLLVQGKLDAFLYDYPYANEEIKPYGDKLEIVQFNLTESTYNVGVRHDQPNLLRMVNSAIRRLKGTNEYREIVRRNLGGAEPPPVERIPAGQEIYRIMQGDTLSGIARTRLHKTSRWIDVWNLNKGRIANPNVLEIGWELLLPTK